MTNVRTCVVLVFDNEPPSAGVTKLHSRLRLSCNYHQPRVVHCQYHNAMCSRYIIKPLSMLRFHTVLVGLLRSKDKAASGFHVVSTHINRFPYPQYITYCSGNCTDPTLFLLLRHILEVDIAYSDCGVSCTYHNLYSPHASCYKDDTNL